MSIEEKYLVHQIKKQLKKQHFSLSALAAQTGLEEAYLNQCLYRRTHSLKLDELRKICLALHLDYSELFYTPTNTINLSPASIKFLQSIQSLPPDKLEVLKYFMTGCIFTNHNYY